MKESERRRHARYPCKAQVKIAWGEVTLDATLRDISASGMYIETHVEFTELTQETRMTRNQLIWKLAHP